MIYIDFIDNKSELIKEKEVNYPKIVKNYLINYRKKSGNVVTFNTEYGNVVKIQNLKKRTLLNLEKEFKINNTQIVCLSSKLDDNEELNKFLKEKKIKKIDGKWINSYLISELVEFIVYNKEEKISEQEVSFLINKNNYLLNRNIFKLAVECKNVNVITKEPNQFKRLEKELSEEGIILNIGNNYKKSLLNTNIIINVDFSEEDFNKFIIPKYSSVININKQIKINKKSFEGINIFKFKYNVDKVFDKRFENFNKNLLYESLISRNSNQENVFKQIKKDNLKITEVYGKNDVIRKKEFNKLKRVK